MIFRLKDYIRYPIPIKRFHDMLSESQYWNQEKRRCWIQEQLDKTLRHAVKNVPYYRKTLKPYESRFNGMIDDLDLRELPLTTKETVRNHHEELWADNHWQYRPTSTHTSGSTGTPTEFLLDQQSSISQFASIWRVLNWTGYQFGDRFANLTGYIIKHDGLFKYDWRVNCLHLSSFNFKRENVSLYIDKLKIFDPVLIKAYPSSLDLFCRWLKEIGITEYRPKVVLTCAESLLDHQRAVIGEILKCGIFDFYNQNERAALISTCEKGNYHIHEEYSFVELQQENNRYAMSENGEGAIIATTFHNLAMPLIRYQTDDLARVVGRRMCECGRTYRTIGGIVGRIEDIVVTPDGRYVGRLDAAFKLSPGVHLSQIVQETSDEIHVKIVKAASFRQKDVENIEEGLRVRLGKVIRIRYDFVDSIAPGTNGKIQFVVSRVGKEALRLQVAG